MTLLFQHSANPARGELEQLRKLLSRLRELSARTRLAVGTGVALANADFFRSFSSIESFRRTTAEEQQRFCRQLSDLELGLRSRDPGVSIGIGLYRIWLADTLAERHEISELLGEELTELSRRAAVP